MKSKSILYVEDDLLVLETVSDILEEEGHSLSTASSVAEAIEQLEKSNYELVILDYTLKGENSEDVITHMKSDTRHNTTPIIVMSGDLNNNIAIKLRSSIDAILIKPVSSDKLLEAIASYTRPRKI